MEKFYAHTDPENPHKLPEDGGRWQELKDHLEQTARLAEEFASAFGSGDWGNLAGLWHDSGKYSQEFQKMLRASADAHIEQKTRVDHSTYGTQKAVEKWIAEGKLLAYAIAGHHGGLPEGISTADSCLAQRLQKPLAYKFDCPAILFEQSKPSLPFAPEQTRFYFELSFFIRMLYSCLVDADFLNTEKHMNPTQSQMRTSVPSLGDLNNKLKDHLIALQSAAKQTKVNTIRAEILSDCLNASGQEPGLFSLTVPTGGGKTLSSLAFGLNHALRWGHERIIYVIPFTSIIEQNAKVFRDILGDDAVLEHHSNYEPAQEDHKTRLASENWDAPVVVTTNIQFFESLFASRSSRSRKLHNIAHSVVILDEVQTLPSEFLLPCLEALRELALHYKCTIILCSATQPAIQHRTDFVMGLQGVREIVRNPVELYEALKRVQTEHIGLQTNEQLISRLVQHEQVLCVVNTRKHARELYEGLCKKGHVYHLSASMYPLHRSEVLRQIKIALKEECPCRVISTQIVEAGVDIDFPVVYRATAGLDSIAQAAGRCNREGLRNSGHVYVFESEHPLPPGFFRHTAQTAEGVMRRFPQDILALEAITDYFKEYYWKQGEALDKEGILALLRQGMKACDFPFRTVAEKFKLIPDEDKPVIIEREPECKVLIEQIRRAGILGGFSRKLQKYTVQVNPWHWNKLIEAGAIEMVCDMFPVLAWPHLYDESMGLSTDSSIELKPDDLIC